MALIAGAGNPAGSGGTAGVGKGLNYALDRVYAYSGQVNVNNVETNLLLFDTGSELIDALIQFRYADTGTAEINEDFTWRIYLNDELILSSTSKANTEWFPEQSAHLIFGAYTQVKITSQNITDSDARGIAATVTGRIINA